MTDADRCTEPVVIDRCRCPDIRGPEDFRDSVSHDEWSRTGRCRYCQDLAFIATADVHARPWLPDHHLGRGALFARSDALDETVLVPFTFGAPGRSPALDLHAIVRVGPSLGRLDPRAALGCLRPQLETHSIRVATGLDDPILERFARCVVLIGFQPQAMADIVNHCPPLARALPDRHILEFTKEPTSPTVEFETAIALFGLDRTHTSRRGRALPLGPEPPAVAAPGVTRSGRRRRRDPDRLPRRVVRDRHRASHGWLACAGTLPPPLPTRPARTRRGPMAATR